MWSLLVSLLAVQTSAPAADRPNAQVLAQAYDRCMATYAVRLTRTDAADAAIFAQARDSCRPLGEQMRAALNAELPPAQAAELLTALDARAEPDFMAMLARIRSDRARRAAQ